jgi:DNA-binding GntR family transcriptional regulator
MPAKASIPAEPLIKQNLADELRSAIMKGALKPGERIVEGTWANQFGVAQASIREAINILRDEGFVTKQSGRSARVLRLSEKDVLQLYQLRGALEGLAARLAAETKAPLAPLQEALHGMRRAAAAGQREKLLDYDLHFHLQLCEAAHHTFLLEHARRILLPFFAFVRMRVISTQQETSVWGKDLEAHQRIIDLIREGEGQIAEDYVRKAMERFAKTAYDNWEKRDPHDR